MSFSQERRPDLSFIVVAGGRVFPCFCKVGYEGVFHGYSGRRIDQVIQYLSCIYLLLCSLGQMEDSCLPFVIRYSG